MYIYKFFLTAPSCQLLLFIDGGRAEINDTGERTEEGRKIMEVNGAKEGAMVLLSVPPVDSW